jgi:hypothetical protein
MIKTLKTLMPDHVEITEKILDTADAALNNDAALITYLRGPYKVERVAVQTPDAPATSKLVICSGEPKAVLIAFVANEKLLIGWAKRNEDVVLVKDAAYEQLVKDFNHKSEFFFSVVEKFIKNAALKEKETSFSKEIGKYIAFLRAGSDLITFKGKRGYSSTCGLLPDVISRSLPRFIARAERVSGLKAANVKEESVAKTAAA